MYDRPHAPRLSGTSRRGHGTAGSRGVHAFHYDWRLSTRDNASALDRFVKEVSGGRKVDVTTHSAGALVALTWIELGGGGNRVSAATSYWLSSGP